ncbi:nonstructural protein [Microvirus mar15]|uniref:Nonstructural protein n=1 Tax=Microvirus mar15 TaxID=2851147 RepID=A0A8F5XRZ7_9VIRU|nr:nonstructural protein [Microvirus mar15]
MDDKKVKDFSKASMYAIYDRLAGTYGEPFCAPSGDIAIRRFSYLMANAPMVAADCDLYCVGYYDVLTGVVSLPLDSKPEFVYRYEVKANE